VEDKDNLQFHFQLLENNKSYSTLRSCNI
jgi:hypothetical protein